MPVNGPPLTLAKKEYIDNVLHGVHGAKVKRLLIPVLQTKKAIVKRRLLTRARVKEAANCSPYRAVNAAGAVVATGLNVGDSTIVDVLRQANPDLFTALPAAAISEIVAKLKESPVCYEIGEVMVYRDEPARATGVYVCLHGALHYEWNLLPHHHHQHYNQQHARAGSPASHSSTGGDHVATATAYSAAPTSSSAAAAAAGGSATSVSSAALYAYRATATTSTIAGEEGGFFKELVAPCVTGLDNAIADCPQASYIRAAMTDPSQPFVDGYSIQTTTFNGIVRKYLNKKVRSIISASRELTLASTFPQTPQLMRQSWLSAVLPPSGVRTIIQLLKPKSFFPGEKIVVQGETSPYWYFLRRGRANVFMLDRKDGQSKQVATLTPGTSFGEMSLIFSEKRTATVIAEGMVDGEDAEENDDEDADSGINTQLKRRQNCAMCDCWTLHLHDLNSLMKSDEDLRVALQSQASIIRTKWLGEQRKLPNYVLPKIIAKSCLFQHCSQSVIEKLTNAAKPRVYAQRGLIASSSALCDCLVIIVRGAGVSLRADVKVRFVAGDVIGEGCLVPSHRWPFAISATSMVDSWVLQASDILRILKEADEDAAAQREAKETSQMTLGGSGSEEKPAVGPTAIASSLKAMAKLMEMKKASNGDAKRKDTMATKSLVPNRPSPAKPALRSTQKQLQKPLHDRRGTKGVKLSLNNSGITAAGSAPSPGGGAGSSPPPSHNPPTTVMSPHPLSEINNMHSDESAALLDAISSPRFQRCAETEERNADKALKSSKQHLLEMSAKLSIKIDAVAQPDNTSKILPTCASSVAFPPTREHKPTQRKPTEAAPRVAPKYGAPRKPKRSVSSLIIRRDATSTSTDVKSLDAPTTPSGGGSPTQSDASANNANQRYQIQVLHQHGHQHQHYRRMSHSNMASRSSQSMMLNSMLATSTDSSPPPTFGQQGSPMVPQPPASSTARAMPIEQPTVEIDHTTGKVLVEPMRMLQELRPAVRSLVASREDEVKAHEKKHHKPKVIVDEGRLSPEQQQGETVDERGRSPNQKVSDNVSSPSSGSNEAKVLDSVGAFDPDFATGLPAESESRAELSLRPTHRHPQSTIAEGNRRRKLQRQRDDERKEARKKKKVHAHHHRTRRESSQPGIVVDSGSGSGSETSSEDDDPEEPAETAVARKATRRAKRRFKAAVLAPTSHSNMTSVAHLPLAARRFSSQSPAPFMSVSDQEQFIGAAGSSLTPRVQDLNSAPRHQRTPSNSSATISTQEGDDSSPSPAISRSHSTTTSNLQTPRGRSGRRIKASSKSPRRRVSQLTKKNEAETTAKPTIADVDAKKVESDGDDVDQSAQVGKASQGQGGKRQARRQGTGTTSNATAIREPVTKDNASRILSELEDQFVKSERGFEQSSASGLRAVDGKPQGFSDFHQTPPRKRLGERSRSPVEIPRTPLHPQQQPSKRSSAQHRGLLLSPRASVSTTTGSRKPSTTALSSTSDQTDDSMSHVRAGSPSQFLQSSNINLPPASTGGASVGGSPPTPSVAMASSVGMQTPSVGSPALSRGGTPDPDHAINDEFGNGDGALQQEEPSTGALDGDEATRLTPLGLLAAIDTASERSSRKPSQRHPAIGASDNQRGEGGTHLLHELDALLQEEINEVNEDPEDELPPLFGLEVLSLVHGPKSHVWAMNHPALASVIAFSIPWALPPSTGAELVCPTDANDGTGSGWLHEHLTHRPEESADGSPSSRNGLSPQQKRKKRQAATRNIRSIYVRGRGDVLIGKSDLSAIMNLTADPLQGVDELLGHHHHGSSSNAAQNALNGSSQLERSKQGDDSGQQKEFSALSRGPVGYVQYVPPPKKVHPPFPSSAHAEEFLHQLEEAVDVNEIAFDEERSRLQRMEKRNNQRKKKQHLMLLRSHASPQQQQQQSSDPLSPNSHQPFVLSPHNGGASDPLLDDDDAESDAPDPDFFEEGWNDMLHVRGDFTSADGMPSAVLHREHSISSSGQLIHPLGVNAAPYTVGTAAFGGNPRPLVCGDDVFLEEDFDEDDPYFGNLLEEGEPHIGIAAVGSVVGGDASLQSKESLASSVLHTQPNPQLRSQSEQQPHKAADHSQEEGTADEVDGGPSVAGKPSPTKRAKKQTSGFRSIRMPKIRPPPPRPARMQPKPLHGTSVLHTPRQPVKSEAALEETQEPRVVAAATGGDDESVDGSASEKNKNVHGAIMGKKKPAVFRWHGVPFSLPQ